MTIVDKFNLKDKVAIITGTTRGLGQNMAEALLEAGATVVALDRSDNDHLSNFSAKHGGKFNRVKVDLLKTTKEELESVVSSIVRDFSKIDILVNNAGISRRGEVAEFSDDDWQDVIKVNMDVPFYLSRAVSEHFVKQGYGKIINIASMLSYQGGLRVPSYAASKHGIVGLTKSFANGLAKHGINVNAIAPGFMATDLTVPLQQDKQRNELILSRIPAGRWGSGDDLKGTLIFLASSMSDYLNGVCIPVDGGWLSR